MGRSCNVLAIILVMGSFIGCDPNTSAKTSKIPEIPDGACYEFVDFKIEDGKWQNEMFLYALRGPLKYDEFRALCLDIKSRAKNGAFTFVVLFDKRENASFPKDPFTAQYGMEDEKMRHIIAIYGMNQWNKFSEINSYYPKNMFEGKPKTERL
jgi:hypothetical protein